MLKTLRPSGAHISLKTSTANPEVVSDYHQLFTQSGTAALAAAIETAISNAPAISKPEVILPAYACPDLISAVIYCNAKPVLIDLEPDSPWMQLDSVKASITTSTVAIIAVNFLGIPERINEIRSSVGDSPVVIIEDSAQGFPVHDEYWHGDIVIVSFSRGKPVNLINGGAVLTKSSGLAAHFPQIHTEKNSYISDMKYRLKAIIFNLIIRPGIYYWVNRFAGKNIGTTIYKPLESIEALADSNKQLLAANIEKYSHQHRLDQLLHDELARLDSKHIIDLPDQCHYNFKNPLLRYPILIQNTNLRGKIFNELNNLGLGCSKLYDSALKDVNKIPADLLSDQNAENAELFSQALLTLPLHDDVYKKDINTIINVFRNCL